MQKKTQHQILELNKTIQRHADIHSNLQNQIDELQKLPKKLLYYF